MKWKAHSRIFTVVSLVLGTASISAVAQSDDLKTQKFQNLDQMIHQLEASTKKGKRQSYPVDIPESKRVLNKPMESPTVSVIEQPVSFNEKRSTTSTPKVINIDSLPIEKPEVDKNLAVRLSELPPMTRFELNSDLFIPANKSGVLFTNGQKDKTIEDGVNVSDLFIEDRSNDSLCALVSDHSHLMFRGSDNKVGRPASFLDVSNIEFLRATSPDSKEEFFVRILFKTKNVSVDGGVAINIKAECRIPKALSHDLKSYTLGDVNNGFGDLFTFKIPKYIEI